MEFGGALKGCSRGNGSNREKEKAGLGSNTEYSVPSSSVPLSSFVEFHAIWVNGGADQTVWIFCSARAPSRALQRFDAVSIASTRFLTLVRTLVPSFSNYSDRLSRSSNVGRHNYGFLSLPVRVSFSSSSSVRRDFSQSTINARGQMIVSQFRDRTRRRRFVK